MALYDPFRVGCCIALYCYKYSTPMGSWMHVTKWFTMLNKKMFRKLTTWMINRVLQKIILKKSLWGM